ncbi:hypothetical protein PHET_01766 [Paragonimus heterotremus]|uniref:Ig-like domain-containing protein n=1 Tax=Paragonimus heterotremus TaxID=100268 RepID=A0A8J4SRQ2_9TREM|nr:hypothetical protein PHET_01766 [Paragonimus heterotremus]
MGQDDYRPGLWRANISCLARNPLGFAKLTLPFELHNNKFARNKTTFILCCLLVAPMVTTNRFVYSRLGRSIRVSCDVISNPPPDKVFWYRTQSNTSDSESVKSPTGQRAKISSAIRYWSSPVLEINSIVNEDAGVYVCVAENKLQPSGEKAFVQRAESATTLFVYCPGLPLPNFRWKWRPRSCTDPMSLREKTVFRGLVRVRNEAELIVPAVGLHDDGVYFCEVYNGIGDAMSNPTNVTIIGKSPDD